MPQNKGKPLPKRERLRCLAGPPGFRSNPGHGASALVRRLVEISCLTEGCFGLKNARSSTAP
jgi:hypothetical protein